MKPFDKHVQWTVLTLTMVLSLILIALDAFAFQPTAASTHPGASRMVSLGNFLAHGQSITYTGLIKIMPLGDSITYGQGSTTGGGYRLPLWHDLRMRGAQITFVGSMQHGPANFPRDNEGRPGWTIRQIAAHVVDWLRTYQPQIILLHIGTNDILKNDNPANAPARLKSLIDQITATLPQATLIVAQIIPVTRRPQFNPEVVTYNHAIPGIVQAEAAQGKHVLLVDMYHAVSPAMLVDGAHPDDRAYALMAQVWENALIPLLKLKE